MADGRKGEAGLTLIEVLISFFLLFVVSLAILGLLSLSIAANKGALARTELQSRAQQVFEAIRMVNAVRHAGGNPADTLIPNPLATTATIDIPNDGAHAFWGSGGVRAVEPGAKYRLSFQIQEQTTPAPENRPFWLVTVTAEPAVDTPVYLGSGIAHKVVRYVGQINQ